ncbi:DUF6303 family protein [Streptomyces sp. NPDC091281]|uniref:DUF6303 family protein n=1 Tax=Streptomyces sp. NPDC091281 TaxID=3365985 RepID=UPI0037FEC44B
MAQEFMAQMSVFRGLWYLYVVLPDPSGRWPEYDFDRAAPVPTFTERADALGVLGFEPVPGAEWRWTEDSQDPDDPASPVVLLAAIQVRSRAGESA